MSDSVENPYARIDLRALLEKLEFRFQEHEGGRKFTASCPNPDHADNSSSWFIRNIPGEPYHAGHKCLGCGFKGGPLALVSAVTGLSEDGARKYLRALDAPSPLPDRIKIEILPPKLFNREATFAFPTCFRFDPLEAWPEEARAYLLERVSPAQVVRWGLGYVADECSCGSGRFVGRHRRRIVVPTFDFHGRPRSYTARTYAGARLRYVEPAAEEGELPAILGERYWGGKEALVATEGGFDAFAAERALEDLALSERVGVAALRGSSSRPDELNRLSMFPRVVLAFDPDRAGAKVRAALQAALGRHVEVRNVRFPAGEDPSGIYRSRPAWLRGALSEALGGMGEA